MISEIDFLNENTLQNVIKTHIDREAKISNVKKIEFPKGENFNSELMRVIVCYSTPNSKHEQHLSIFAKYLPDDTFMIQFSKNMKYYEREMLMYRFTLSEMYKFGCLKCIAPKSYLIVTEPKPIMLLEDLSVHNYETIPRDVGLDMDHCFFVLDRLAAFHASSVALYEKDPTSMKVFNQALFGNIDGIKDIMLTGLEELIQTCKRWTDLAKYFPKLELIQKNFIEILRASNQPSQKFNVLNHGDLWNNNILFKHNTDGKIKDVRFVDYQVLYYSSPAIDLHYFLVVGANFEAKKNATTLLRYYLKKLTHYLKQVQVKVDPPSWDDFLEDFISRACYELFTSCVTLAFMKAKDRLDSNINNFLNSNGENGFRYYAFNNCQYLKEIRAVFALLEDMEVFKNCHFLK